MGMSLLRDRRFALLLAGSAVNAIGSWCALVALWGYANYRFDATPLQIALLSLSWALPPAVFGPFGGVPVDRFGPRRVLVAADFAAAACALALAFSTSYSQLVVLGALIGCTRLFSEPAFGALAPRLVDDRDLLHANALLGAAFQSAIAFGPLLAALSIGAWGMQAAFVVDALTYLVGIAVVLPLRLRPVEPEAADRSLWNDVRAGVRVVRARPDARDLLALGATVYAVWGAYAVIEPIYVRDVLGESATVFAVLQAVFGTVLFACGLTIPRLGPSVARFGVVRWAVLGTAAAAPFYVGTSLLGVAVVGIAIWGGATAFFVAPHRTLLQRATPVTAHGRVMALDAALRNWAHVIALPVAALCVSALGVRAAALAFASVPVAGALFAGRPRAERAPGVDPGGVAVVPADGDAPRPDELGVDGGERLGIPGLRPDGEPLRA